MISIPCIGKLSISTPSSSPLFTHKWIATHLMCCHFWVLLMPTCFLLWVFIVRLLCIALRIVCCKFAKSSSVNISWIIPMVHCYSLSYAVIFFWCIPAFDNDCPGLVWTHVHEVSCMKVNEHNSWTLSWDLLNQYQDWAPSPLSLNPLASQSIKIDKVSDIPDSTCSTCRCQSLVWVHLRLLMCP